MNKLLEKIYNELYSSDKWLSPREIKIVRRYFRLTQVDFAELLGISYHTYRNWEIGHRVPSSPAMALLYVARDYPDIFLKNRRKLLDKLKGLRKHS